MTTFETVAPGFRISRGWARDYRTADVIEAIPWRQETIRVFGREVLQPRLTAWMGSAPYTYSGLRHDPAPLPPALYQLLGSLQWMSGCTYNSVLGNLYRDGRDSVAWHADDESELGERPTIASLSVGGARRFSIKERATGKRIDVVLEHGDLLVMSGRSQLDYLHAVPKSRRFAEPRVNLTFRHVSC